MPSPYKFQILLDPSSPSPVRFAATELRRCLMRMTEENVRYVHVHELPLQKGGSIIVGTRGSFSEVLGDGECPENELDDQILVTQRNGNCIVTGSNPRSVLFAAYELLERLGAAWTGPGHLAEIIPESDCSAIFEIEVSERAAYRHRGVCIEGAPSLDHALGMIDWMAKRKMNSFFLQFKTSIYFWTNYYSREYNMGYGSVEDIDRERSLELDQEVIDAAKLRGFVIHRVGHGWTAESLGHSGLGWWKADREPDDDTRQLLAEVGGRRGFFGDIPINTELCYSNKRAFDGVVDEIVGYAREHPEVDCLHFWLSDATNNFCECESCIKVTPSDWYARLIKAARRGIRREKLKTRLVFLCYTNTLTPPNSEKLSDAGLIYMFAPISRCYSHPLADPKCSGIGQAGGWPLNSVKPPRTNAEFLQIRKAWGEVFGGDSFVFDYYLWQPYLRHLNPIGFARLINRDVASYGSLYLNGLVSCQALRSFYPLGLSMAAMAETLWDVDANLEDLVSRHTRACFPSHAEEVLVYLKEIDRIISPGKRHGAPFDSGRVGKSPGVGELLELTKNFSSRLMVMKPEGEVEERYLSLICHFNRLLGMRCKSSLLLSEGKRDEAEAVLNEAGKFLRDTEELTHRYLDLWLILRSMRI